MHGTHERFNPQGVKPNPWTPERQARLIELAQAGLTALEISRELGVSRGSIMGRMRRTRVPLAAARGPQEARPEYRRIKDYVIKAVEAGHTIIEIANALRVTYKSARWHVRSMNLVAKPTGRHVLTRAERSRGGVAVMRQKWGEYFKPQWRPEPSETLRQARSAVLKVRIPPADERIPLAQRKTFLELTSKHCHWPVGDPAQEGFFFCGGEAFAHWPYCKEHCARAYRVGE